MSTHESWAQWRLFTRSDFEETLDRWKTGDLVSCGVGATFLADGAQQGENGHVHLGERAIAGASGALSRHVRALKFEHGREGKIPRANTYRPYRLTLNGKLAAVIALRASEAFNLCEIDVFLTTELPGLTPLEPTRAAMLFAFSDAVKTGGSMAVQFSRPCAPRGLPPHVQAVAAQAGVKLQHADRATLSPEEVRELFLRLCGLSATAQQRVREFAKRHLFSSERISQLVAAGIWPANEAACVLLSCPYPELVLGSGVDAPSRLLSAHALAAASTAILCGIFDRALRYDLEVGESAVVEREQYFRIPLRMDPKRLATHYGKLASPTTVHGWSPVGNLPLVLPPQTEVVALPRPRAREEIRVFLRQDLEQAHAVAGAPDRRVLLIYPADYLLLPEEERIEATQAAERRGVIILACPESVAGLQAESWRRQRVGRTIRQ